ncbi:MAG: 30S ribosomal protein S8, partial [Nitrospirae bacterium]|nr:30S ribosomal protein S8 [Nitrospirota bacterium]
YIRSYRILDTPPQATLSLTLKYNLEDRFAIVGLRRVSKPGRRVYVSRREIPRVLGGLGISILSTPRGMRTDAAARKENLGGELLCYVW